MKAVAATLAALALSGCGSSGVSSARWYAPATWFSHAPAAAVDRAERKEDAARDSAIKQAQRATHETDFALRASTPSRSVSVATAANADAVALLDQAAGPLGAGELAAIQKRVADLLSENAKLRADAEAATAAQRETAAQIGDKLAKAQAAADVAERGLRAAFERENALANDLRTQRALAWIIGGVAVLCAAGWIYLRFALGGLPMAAGKLMRDLRASNPAVAPVVESLFDRYLNRHEQAAISKHAS